MTLISADRVTSCVRLFVLIVFANLVFAEDQFHGESLRFGLYDKTYPEFSPEELKVSLKLIAEEIGKRYNLPITVSIFDDIIAMRSAFENDEINAVVATPLNFVRDFDSKTLAVGFKLVPFSDFPEALVVLARKQANLVDFKSMHGKRLVLVEEMVAADLYMSFLSLSKFNENYQESFHLLPHETKASAAILKLFFGQADITCIYLSQFRLVAEMNPQLLDKLKIIAQLDSVPESIAYFHSSVDPALREYVISETSKLGTYARGQQLLQMFKGEKMVKSTVADLSAIKKLFEDTRKLSKNKIVAHDRVFLKNQNSSLKR